MLQSKKEKRPLRVIAVIFLVLAVLTVALCIFIAVFTNKNINFQNDEQLFEQAGEESILRLYALNDNERVLYEELCFSENRKSWVNIENVSQSVKEAFLAAEDRDFYKHSGVNLKRTLYAAWNVIFKRQALFGASTITQQVIKNISGDDDMSFKRKFAEILRAFHMEKRHTKDEIFGVYLNIVPLSENVVGVQSGAAKYFNKDASELNAAEAATLAGITNAPTRFNPYLHPDACLKKRNNVLFAMYDSGFLSEEEYAEYCGNPLNVAERKNDSLTVSSWFSETVINDVISAFVADGYSEQTAKQLLYRGGLSIDVTVNPTIQKTMEEILENKEYLPAETKDGLKFAMCLIDPDTGNLLGIIGNSGKKTANHVTNYATTAHAPGSSLKPIALYAPLIDEGKISAATVFDDVPLSFHSQNGKISPYPNNSPKVYGGLTTVTDALRLSKNTVAMRLYKMRGAEAIYGDLYNTFVFDTLIRKKTNRDSSTLTDLAAAPLALGQLTNGVSLRKLTEAYSVFPADGVLHRGRSFTKVTDRNGNVILINEPSSKRVYKSTTAKIMNQLLSSVVKDGTAKSITLKNCIATAGKTGTSGEDKDRIFIGYTPNVVGGIWCGYENKNHPISNVSPNHLTIWDTVMTKVQNAVFENEDTPMSFSTEGLIRCSYCKDSGERFCPSCSLDPRNDRMAYGYFTADNQPNENCTRHVTVAYDSLTDALACEHCPLNDLKLVSLVRVEDRSFPIDVLVTDAEYVYREIGEDTPRGDNYDIPYFYYTVKDGQFVGRSPGSKQFNSYCYLHDDGEAPETEKSA